MLCWSQSMSLACSVPSADSSSPSVKSKSVCGKALLNLALQAVSNSWPSSLPHSAQPHQSPHSSSRRMPRLIIPGLFLFKHYSAILIILDSLGPKTWRISFWSKGRSSNSAPPAHMQCSEFPGHLYSRNPSFSWLAYTPLGWSFLCVCLSLPRGDGSWTWAFFLICIFPVLCTSPSPDGLTWAVQKQDPGSWEGLLSYSYM